MDPTQTLADILLHLGDADQQEATELMHELSIWLRRGGLIPQLHDPRVKNAFKAASDRSAVSEATDKILAQLRLNFPEYKDLPNMSLHVGLNDDGWYIGIDGAGRDEGRRWLDLHGRDKTLYLLHIVIPEPWRGQGKGAKFLKAVEGIAEALGYAKVETTPSGTCVGRPAGDDSRYGWYLRRGWQVNVNRAHVVWKSVL